MARLRVIELIKAKCKDCHWQVKASGSVLLWQAIEAHTCDTGHKVKVKQ